MAQTQVTVPYQANYDFGIGVDLATGSPMGKSVDGEVSGVTDAHGATGEFRIDRLYSTSDLEKALSIDVEASGGCGCFSASARMSYAKKSKVQTTSLFMAVTARVALENLSIDDPVLSKNALEIVERSDAFATRYGNMFVRGIGRGGLFVAVMQIDTSNSEESESVSAELGGSYGLFSAKAQMAMSNVQKNYHSDIRISAYHEGGPAGLVPEDIQDATTFYAMLQQWLKSFQDDPAKNSVPYSVTLAPIAIANGPIPPNQADLEHAQDVLVICAKQRSTIMDGLNQMDYIIQNPTRYDYKDPTTPDDVVAALAGYELDLDLVADAASNAIDHPADAVTPAQFAAQKGQKYPQGVPPSPMPTFEKGLIDVLARKGETLAAEDPLALALAAKEPEGDSRRGFYIGMGAAEGHTLPGPGKDKIQAGLPEAQKPGFSRGVQFSVERNRNVEVINKGAAVAKADPAVAAARENVSPFYSLGFDLATGYFGDPALGAIGNTLTGPGSLGARETLGDEGRRGFDAGVKFHLGPPLRARRA
jgi:hypothetical protein